MSLLTLDNLSVTITTDHGPIPILENINLTLAPGETLGLVGESGCGKSMTALAIMGLLPRGAQAKGRMQFGDRDLLTLSERHYCGLRGREIAMVFQEPMTALNPVKTIGYQIAEGMKLHMRLAPAEVKARTRQLLDRVGLPQPRFSPDLYPHQLSGGQRQRVVLAIALACQPKLLIADEPTTALDVTIQAQILDLISEIVEQTRMSLLLITHDLGVIAQTVDRLGVMYAGHIVEQGATAAVFKRLAHPYSHGLLQAMPQTHAPTHDPHSGVRLRLQTIPGVVPDPGVRPNGCIFAERCPRVQQHCRSNNPKTTFIDANHTVSCFYPIVGNT